MLSLLEVTVGLPDDAGDQLRSFTSTVALWAHSPTLATSRVGHLRVRRCPLGDSVDR